MRISMLLVLLMGGAVNAWGGNTGNAIQVQIRSEKGDPF